MKNKKNIYILLPAVLIVWGILIFKLISGLNPTTPTSQNSQQVGQFTPKQLTQAETFTIQADYRDPFLGTFEKKKQRAVKRNTQPSAKIETTPFPSIEYKGIVSPKGKNEKVFLVRINGTQHLFKRNNKFNDVKLLKGNAQEITLQFQKQVQTFQLEK